MMTNDNDIPTGHLKLRKPWNKKIKTYVERERNFQNKL